MSARLDFRLLGPFDVARDGEVVAIGGLRRRAVLAMLALEPGRVVSAGRLIEGVWGEEPPKTAATALHGHVSYLRRALGPVIVTRAPGYLLDVDPATVDVRRFEAGLERARACLAGGDARAAARALDEALRLWRGAPLGDLAEAPFATGLLPSLEELGTSAREERLEIELALGRADEAIPALRALVAEHPLRERPRGQLMLALYRAGRHAEALESYDAARRTLSEELGIEPGEPLRRLHEAILREDPSLGRAPRRPAGLPQPGRGSRRRIAALGGVAALAAAAAVAAIAGGGANSAAPLRGSGVVRIDPEGLRVATAIPLDGTPTNIAAAGGRAWVINAEDQTISELSGSRRVRTFATAASPADLAATDEDLWVAQGSAEATELYGSNTTSVAHLAGSPRSTRATIALPPSDRAPFSVRQDRLALSRRAVWVIAADGALVRIDPLSDEVVRVLPLKADAVAADGDRAWVLGADRTLVPVAEQGTSIGIPIDVPGMGDTFVTAGAGAVWLSNRTTGTLTRIDPDAPQRARTTAVGAGAGPVAFGHGAAWVADGGRRRVLRIDPETAAVTGEVAVGGTPRDIAVSADGVWVSVSSRATAATACGPTVQGGARADAIIVADLPLRGGPRRPTQAMARAIGYVVRHHGHRAGRTRIGYRVCDDSTAQSSTFDPGKCAANAHAYAADRRVVVEVGPYNSPCAAQQLPIAAQAPGGPLAMVSPTNTAASLTRDVRAGDRRAYARVIGRDDRQGAVMAGELRRRGVRTVYVADDAAGGPTYGLELAGYFAAAARSAGLRVVGRGSWAGRGGVRALVRRVARARPDAVYVSGDLGGGGRVIDRLRRALPPGTTIAGNDLLLPVAGLFEAAGEAARGVLITTSVLPVAAMPRRARALAATLARDQGRSRVHPYAVYAAVATEVAIDAIARSDGSRRSVGRALLATALPDGALGPVAFDPRGDLREAPVTILRAVRAGGSHEIGSTEGAEVVAVRR